MKIATFGLGAALLGAWTSNASATLAYWEISHTFPSDLIITIGVGNISSPLWYSVVQSHEWDFSDTVDISAGNSYLYGNTWWIGLNDLWSADGGTLTSFFITDTNAVTYSSQNTPLSLPDLSNRYAYIDVPAQVPVPATLALMGLGLAGAGFQRRRKAA